MLLKHSAPLAKKSAPLYRCWTPTPPGSEVDTFAPQIFSVLLFVLRNSPNNAARIRATFYEAIIQYGVTGKEPTLPKSISGYWPIIQPVLDTSHKRYDAAKKRNKSSENNGFATYKEKEKEKENEKERDKEKEKEAADAVSGGATQQDRQDVFAQFAGEDSALLQALQDYDLMRQEKHKELTDTMRRSLCRQLDEEFHRCEWVEIVKQATMRGWMRFYPLDEPKPHQSQQRQPTAEEEYTRLFNEVCGGGTP